MVRAVHRARQEWVGGGRLSRTMRNRGGAVLVAFVVTMLAFAGPAAAAGSFTWSASMVYYITPQRKAGAGWTNYTARAYLCGWSETNTWNTSAGTYRFVITTTDEGVTLSGNGTTRYP